jgi:hypothetical protein
MKKLFLVTLVLVTCSSQGYKNAQGTKYDIWETLRYTAHAVTADASDKEYAIMFFRLYPYKGECSICYNGEMDCWYNLVETKPCLELVEPRAVALRLDTFDMCELYEMTSNNLVVYLNDEEIE